MERVGDRSSVGSLLQVREGEEDPAVQDAIDDVVAILEGRHPPTPIEPFNGGSGRVIGAAEVPAAIAAHAPHAGVFLDLDGTLAPIVARPELARILPEILPTLARMARLLDVVAVISGRPSGQVRELVGVEDVVIVGTHGLEDERPMQANVLEEIEAAAAAVGAWVEPKGAAAAVHFRALEDPKEAERVSAGRLAVIAATYDLEVIPGKRILELAPAGRPRKGGAVERIARDRDLEAVLFAGDDVGDLDAFAALDRLRACGLWTCAVAARGPDTPPEVAAAADLVVDGPMGMAAFLAQIADELDRRAQPT
jgi:trehalose 6-phosphate phosphatase